MPFQISCLSKTTLKQFLLLDISHFHIISYLIQFLCMYEEILISQKTCVKDQSVTEEYAPISQDT